MIRNLTMVFSITVVLLFLPIKLYAEKQLFPKLTPLITPAYEPQGELESGLWMTVEKAEKSLKNSPNRIRDPILNQYVNDIVCRLAKDYCKDIRVYIMRQPYFNAAMYPNGVMVIWSGLLLRVDNEAQLAAVIGHELGHYFRRHTLNSYIDAKEKSDLATLLSLGFAVAGIGLVGSLTDYMIYASIFAHQRDQEYEADQYGIQLMNAAGYDASEAANVWDSVIQEDKADKNNDGGGVPFFASHPPPEDRFEKLSLYAEKLTNKPVNRPKHFQRIVSPFWADFLRDQIVLNQAAKSEYVLAELAKKQANLGTVYYFKGEMYRLRKQEGDTELAEKSYIKAIEYDDVPKEVFRELGLLKLKKKQFEVAREYFNNYLLLNPDAVDKEMINYYLSMGN